MTFIIGYLVTTTISKSVIEFVKRDIEKSLIKNNYSHLLDSKRKRHIDSVFSDEYTYLPIFNISIAIYAIVGMENLYKSIVETDVKKEKVETKKTKIETLEIDYSIESDLELLKKFRDEVSVIDNNCKAKELDLSYFKN